MKSKDLQKVLKEYPEDYEICIDTSFPWEEHPHLVDPHLFIDNATGQIEISTPIEEIKSFWNTNNELPKANKVCLCKETTISPIKICSYNDSENIWIEYNTFEKIQYEKIKYWAYIPEIDCE